MDLAKQAAARAELEADLEALRRHGVKSFSQTATGFDVEFFPPEPKPLPDRPKKPNNEPDVCACGHAEFEHMHGFCIHECGAEKCDPKK